MAKAKGCGHGHGHGHECGHSHGHEHDACGHAGAHEHDHTHTNGCGHVHAGQSAEAAGAGEVCTVAQRSIGIRGKCELGELCTIHEGSCEGTHHDQCHLTGGTTDRMSVLRKMWIALAIATTFMVFQFVAGYITGSIAIMTDAVHELSDAFNYAVAIFATILTARQAPKHFSFGYHRAETIGALINVICICVLSLTLVLQAIERLVHPEEINGRLMFIFASVGLGVNLFLLMTIGHEHPPGQECGHHHHGHGHGHGGCNHGHGHGHTHGDHARDPVSEVVAASRCLADEHGGCDEDGSEHGSSTHGHHHHRNASLQGIEMHIIADVLQQVGLTIAGAILWWQDGNPDWLWVDPVCTFIFAFFVVLMTRELLMKSIKNLMEAMPAHVNVDKLVNKLRAIEGVTGVHDLHVWGISNDKVLMTAHINVRNESDRAMINSQADTIAQRAGITHCTVQLCVVEAAY